MSRINTNVNAMLAQRVMGQKQAQQNQTLERLSTGLRINRGADDPAGLIASENLRSEKSALNSAISNGERASQVINIAEGGLTEISSMMNDLQGLVTETANDAGLSKEEKEANQSEVDSILQTIDRIANSTSFQGSQLLNGNFDYETSNVNSSQLENVEVDSAKVPNDGELDVSVDITQSAQRGVVFLSGGGANLDTNDTGPLTLEIAGQNGTQEVSFASGAAMTDVVAGINDFAETTGVSASLSGNIMKMESREFGSDPFVSVSVIDGDTGISSDTYTANNGTNDQKDTGRDASVNINGQTAQVDGLKASVSNSALDVTVDVAEAHNSDGNQSSFKITGGGATFQISSDVSLAGQGNIGIRSTTTSDLGLANDKLSTLQAGGDNNIVDGNLTKAQDVVEEATKQVSKLRGRLGSFQSNTVDAMTRQLGVTLENTSAAESTVRDADFAKEAANLTRSQIMTQAAQRSLSLANQQPQSVLQLLG